MIAPIDRAPAAPRNLWRIYALEARYELLQQLRLHTFFPLILLHAEEIVHVECQRMRVAERHLWPIMHERVGERSHDAGEMASRRVRGSGADGGDSSEAGNDDG